MTRRAGAKRSRIAFIEKELALFLLVDLHSSMKPILYSFFRSSASYRVRIALNLKGIDYEYRAVNLLKGEQRGGVYLALNPKGEVPFFVDGDFKLTQSLVICEYLDSKWKMPRLFPENLKRRLRCLEICELIGSGIQPIQNTSVVAELKERFGASEEARADWIRFFVGRGLVAVEKILSETAGSFSLGDEVSAADVFLIPQVFSAERFQMDLSVFPTIKKVNDHCLSIDAFKRAHPSLQPDVV